MWQFHELYDVYFQFLASSYFSPLISNSHTHTHVYDDELKREIITPANTSTRSSNSRNRNIVSVSMIQSSAKVCTQVLPMSVKCTVSMCARHRIQLLKKRCIFREKIVEKTYIIYKFDKKTMTYTLRSEKRDVGVLIWPLDTFFFFSFSSSLFFSLLFYTRITLA